MNKFIIAITGPAGAGKSTVSEKLAKQFDDCVNIEADHVKHFVVSGFKKKQNTDGSEDWDFTEWELVGESIGLLAHNFQEKGFSVIINGYINEPAWQAIEKHVTLTHKVLLLPHLDQVKGRDQQRKPEDQMGEKAISEHHDYFSTNSFYSDFVKIDSSEHDIDQTVQAILDIVRQS